MKDIVMTATRRILMGLAFLIPMYTSATVNAQTIQLLTEPRALSIVVLRIEVNELSDDRAVYLELKGPSDADYRELYLFSTEYSEIEGRRFTNPVNGKRQLIVPVFVEHVKTWEHGKHIFEEAGLYSLRLKAYDLSDPGSPPMEHILFESQVVFTEPLMADLKYCEIAMQDNFGAKLGFDKALTEPIAATRETLIGLGVVHQIVHSTRRKGDPSHGKSEWADPLYHLAFAVPDSSYAPYVAYYAACSYMWQRKAGFVKRTYGYELPDRRIADLTYYRKARRAVEFAANRGDPYIRPFAMCFLAAMNVWADDVVGAHEIIQRVKKEPNTPKDIAGLVDQAERYTEKVRGKAGNEPKARPENHTEDD